MLPMVLQRSRIGVPVESATQPWSQPPKTPQTPKPGPVSSVVVFSQYPKAMLRWSGSRKNGIQPREVELLLCSIASPARRVSTLRAHHAPEAQNGLGAPVGLTTAWVIHDCFRLDRLGPLPHGRQKIPNGQMYQEEYSYRTTAVLSTRGYTAWGRTDCSM